MPNSFTPDFLRSLPVSQNLLQTIRALGEYKGQEILFERQAPRVLEALRQAAVIRSTESSNRIEGIVAPLQRISDLVNEKTVPRNRSEQEIAGYRSALATIHANHEGMTFTPNLVLQLHRDLFRLTSRPGGSWKIADNEITETRPDGSRIVRFRPVPAHRTADAMTELHARFDQQLRDGMVEPLLLVAAYILDFLCVHPFLDGNGRIARLLSLLLLYQQGFAVGRYISFEQVIEQHREGYYEALQASSVGWHEGQHSLAPWAEYFLGVMMLGAYRDLERRTGELSMARGAKSAMVRESIGRLPGEFRYADLASACPGVSRPTIRRVLDKLRQDGQVECVRVGRDALWRKL